MHHSKSSFSGIWSYCLKYICSYLQWNAKFWNRCCYILAHHLIFAPGNLPPPILGTQPLSQFFFVFNMINKSFTLTFYTLLSCLEWIAVLNCQQNINYLDKFWVFSSTHNMTLTWTCVMSLTFLGYGQTLHVFINFEEKLLVKLCSYLSCLQRNLSL